MNRKLKPFVMPMIYGILAATALTSIVLIQKVGDEKVLNDSVEYTYVNKDILTDDVPVISEDDTVIIKPFTKENVTVSKKFYDKNMSKEDKQNAIIYYNDTYMQNTGVLFNAEEQFEINSILDGTVVEVKKDDVLGNVVEIKHDNNLISTYQGLSEVTVKKDQSVKQGDIIGKSGKLDIDTSLDNALLFELIYNGKLVNPESYFDKKVSEL